MSALDSRRLFLVFFGLFLAAVLAAFLCTLFGAEKLTLSSGFLHGAAEMLKGRRLSGPAALFWELRVPRVLMAGLAGGALSVAGAGLQGLLRNPLADPFILGVSGGGALGAVLAMLLGVSAVAGVPAVPFFAFAGSLATVLVVFRIAMQEGRVAPHTLLLSGVVANAFLSALIMFIVSVAPVKAAHSMVNWMMGSVGYETYATILGIGAYVLPGVLVLASLGRDLNLLALGEDAAAQSGVAVEQVKAACFFAASLLTGAVVSVSGLIGFAGLIVPHITRLLFGPDHRLLIPACFLTGAVFLMGCDTLARTMIAPMEIPVGVITAIAGGPFFIFLLRKRKATGFEEV